MCDASILPRSFQAFAVIVLLLSPACAFGQNASPDFRFGPSGKTTVTLSEESLIDVMINGKGPFHLIFDTGASVNILNPEVIAQLNLPASNLDEQLRGTSGGQFESKSFHADELRIGDLTLTNQNFFSVPIPLPKSYGIVGAIGYELFSRVVATADYEHHKLTLSDPATFSNSGSGQKLDLQPDPLQLIVQARLGKAAGNFILDTGALGQSGISFHSWFVRKHHLERKFVRHYHGVFSEGADGKAPASTIERIGPVCLGYACIPGLVGELTSANGDSPYAGRIGLDVVHRFTTTIDWQRHALYIERSSRWNQPLVYDQTGLLTDFADSGTDLVVSKVFSHSPASRAHVKAGDRILLIDNHPAAPSMVSDDPAFLQPAGTRVKLTVQRGGATLQIALILKDIL
jgi:hypothetical protein